MGGIGSGQYTRHYKKTNTEQSKRIDIRYMRKEGLLKPGRQGQLLWNIGGHPIGDIRYETHLNHMAISYHYRLNCDAEWQPIEQQIPFDRTPCNYGGERLWFLCPSCSTRVAILYGSGPLFLCRHCHQLPYESQQLNNITRLIEKKHKQGQKTFARYEYGEGWGKPKGMHWKTFHRRQKRYRELEDAYLHQLSQHYPGLMGYF